MLPGIAGECIWALAGWVGLVLTPGADPFSFAALGLRFLQALAQAAFIYTIRRADCQAVDGGGVRGNQLVVGLLVANIVSFLYTAMNAHPAVYAETIMRSVQQPNARHAMQYVFSLVMFNRFHSSVLLLEVHEHLFHEEHGVDGKEHEGREHVAGCAGEGGDGQVELGGGKDVVGEGSGTRDSTNHRLVIEIR